MRVRGARAFSVLALILVTCSSSPDEPRVSEQTTASTSTEVETDDLEQESDTGDSESLSVDVERQLSASRQNLSVEIKSIAIEGQGIYVTIGAQSRDRTMAVLAYTEPSVFLEDDLGNIYPWQAPEENESLKITLGDRLTARLGFVGPIEEGAQSLTLYLNYSSPGNPWGFPGVPAFRFEDLPIPGR